MNDGIKSVNEGQTQVYSNGMIEPQYGVDVNVPYLNAPPKQLLDLTAQFYKSGKNDSQVLAILVGMGVPQQLALSGINILKFAMNQSSQNENNQKNHNKMKFTLTNLYENVMNSIDTLRLMKADGSRISYSASTALNILENSLRMFPHNNYADYINKNNVKNSPVIENKAINYTTDKFALVRLGEMNNSNGAIPIFVGQAAGVLVETNNDENVLIERSKQMLRGLSVKEGSNSSISFKVIELTPAKIDEISNFIDHQKNSEDTSIDINSVILKETMNVDERNPNLKYRIAKSLHRELSQYDWLLPVQELRTYISDMNNVSKWSFRISEAIDKNSSGKGPLVESLINDLTITLKESNDVKGVFTKVATKYPWSTDVKAILNEMAIEDKKATANNAGTINWVLSPVIENENGLNFSLHGKTYAIKGGQISESVVNDQRFFNVLEGLGLFKYKDNKLVIFGRDDKTLEYDLSEGKLTLGEANLSELSPEQIKESLLSTNFFGYKHYANADVVAKFFESIDLLNEMDNFTNISSTEYLGLYLTMIAVEEGYWINKVNSSMKLNEMKFISSATETLKVVKEFINYDAFSILSERLVNEGNEFAKLIKRRTEISERISFLENKRGSITDAINKIGKSEELDEALNLINFEISKFEKELQKTYTVTEKKTKRQYLDQGFVDATIEKPFLSFKPGTNVYVNAEEFVSMGDNDMISFIDPATDKSHISKKKNIKVNL